MEFSQLRYFLAVANCGQIVQAAETLHVSQSAVSMAISRLEKELDVKLFEKKGRGIQLTNTGTRFMELITPALAELDFAQKQIMAADHVEQNTITLSVEMPDFATTLERIYCKINPGARFRQAMDTTESAKQKLLCANVDFCISYEAFHFPDVTSIHILREPALIQLHADHPLAERESLDIQELSEMLFATFSPEYSFRRWTDAMCFMAGFRPNVCFEACDTQSLMAIVRSHMAAAFVGESTFVNNNHLADHPTVDDTSITTVPLRNSFAERNVYFSYHKNRILSVDAQDFLDFVLQFKTAMERFDDIIVAENWLLCQ